MMGCLVFLIRSHLASCQGMTLISVALVLLLLCGCAGSMEADPRRDMYRMQLQGNPPVEDPATEDIHPNHLSLARTLVSRRYYKIALVQLDKADKSHEKNRAEISFLKGICLRETGHYREAVASLKKAIELDSNYSPAFNALGLTYDMWGKRKAAIRCYKRAIDLNPAIPDYYNNLAYAELMDKRYDTAKRHLEKALLLNPRHEKALNNLALCMVMTGDLRGAFQVMKRLYPLPEVYNNIGVMFYMKGDMDNARKMYEKALEIAPHFKAARKNLDLIRRKEMQGS